MDYSEWTTEQLEARASAILQEMEGEDADLEVLREEARALSEELRPRREEARRREERSHIAAGGGNPITTFEEETEMPDIQYNNKSPEYRRAWLKDLAQRLQINSLGEMTAEERAAFTATTTNSSAVVPHDTANRIIELVEAQAPMLQDAEHTAFSRGFSVPRHKSIKKGDAKGVAEGTAPADDEENEFDSLPLDGIELKKFVSVSRKMQFQSIDAFETWLTKELADRIAVAKEGVIIARLKGEAPDGGTVVEAAGIDTGNKLTEQTFDDATIRKIFGQLKGQGVKVVYANSSTIWDDIAGIENSMGQKLFVPSAMVDPVVQGRIYGASVKQDDNLADNEIFVGVERSVLANDFIDLEVIDTINGNTGNRQSLGYSLFDAGLKNPKSFVHATFSPGE